MHQPLLLMMMMMIVIIVRLIQSSLLLGHLDLSASALLVAQYLSLSGLVESVMLILLMSDTTP